jgi:hypothetical protein
MRKRIGSVGISLVTVCMAKKRIERSQNRNPGKARIFVDRSCHGFKKIG